MRIDVHAHYWTEDYLEMLTDLGSVGTDVARGIGVGGGAELDARLRLMDRTGSSCRCCPRARSRRTVRMRRRRPRRPGSSTTSTPV
jgi:hypothetical protein